jgi:hypothetical protein
MVPCSTSVALENVRSSSDTVEPLLSGLMTCCRCLDNKKPRIIKDDPKRPVNAPRTVC